MSHFSIPFLLGFALSLAACSDQKDQAPQESSSSVSPNKQSVAAEQSLDPFGPNKAAPPDAPDTTLTTEAESMANQLGVPAAEVESLITKVKQFRDEIAGDLRLASGQQAVAKTERLIQQLSKAGHEGNLSQPMIQVLNAAAADGAGHIIFRAGFLNLDATQLGSQMMLYSSVEQMAKNRADLLVGLFQQRVTTAAPSAADLIVYTAVTAGIQDNTIFQRTGSESMPPAVQPFAADLLKLSTSPNPVYRLLAISLAQRLEPDATKLESFYAAFASEAEPYVKSAARRMIESANTPNSADLLQRFGAP